jgi:hypothetical protein
MLKIKSNIPQVINGLNALPARIDTLSTRFFTKSEKRFLREGRKIVEEVVYMAFPERNYDRRGTTTRTQGILNSIVVLPQGHGVTLGITSGSSALADTIPKTRAGKQKFDTYAGWMITGGGFLEPLGIDIRNFLDVWLFFFGNTLPEQYMDQVITPAVKSALRI